MDEEQSIFKIIGGQEYDQQTQKKNQQNRIQQLSNAIQETYPKTYINIQEDIEKDTYVLIFPLESYSGFLKILFDITIKFEYKEFEFKAFICDQDCKLQIHQKLLRLQVCRYALRINNGLRVGSFFINPVFGDIGLNLQCLNTQKDLFFSTNEDLNQFMVYLDNLIMTAIYSMRFHFLRIMFMINKINLRQFKLYEKYLDQVKYKENNKMNWRKFPKDTEMLLQRIKNVVKNKMHLEFNTQEYEILGPLIKKQIMTDTQCSIEIIPENQNGLQVDQQCQINEGGFCTIYSKEIAFKMKKDGVFLTQAQKRTLVIKVDKIEQGNKMKQEIEIIRILSKERQHVQENNSSSLSLNYFTFSGCCPYIAQFYYLQDRSDILLMERYFHSSLDYFKLKQEEVLSLSTRIFIAHSIAMGLRYIHNYGIIHMDIKSANILISKTLMAKITDFGEAINTNKIVEGQKPGLSLPFCAPEIYQNLEANQFTYAYDIYSFGVLFFELLFDRYPFDFRIQNFKSLEDKLQRKNYFVRYNEKYEKLVGPQHLMKYLGRLCIQCLQPDPKNRPNLDKIILVLKDSLTFLDQVY